MKTITLQNRIIILLTIFTIVTIGAFVAVQLSHELNITTQQEIYKANIVSLIIEERLDKILNLSLTEKEKVETLGKAMGSFKESDLIDKSYVLNGEGNIVTATEKWLIGSRGDYVDAQMVDMLNKREFTQRETFVDKTAKLFSLFLPVEDEAGTNFILRVFFSLGDVWAVIGQVYQPVIILGVALVVINIVLGVFLSRVIITPIKVFNEAAKIIASGRLDMIVDISTNDELEELGSTFNYMTKELVKMKNKAENANPLTKLPGNIVIMDDINKKIKENKKFTVIYCDLDNFKAFNDKYGIHKGDDAIKLAGEIFKEAVKNRGDQFDFIGHEGGDDFLLVTTPDRAEGIARYIIAEFDKRVRALYDKEDLSKGYMVAHDRDGKMNKFPIMTISLAGITNEDRAISSYGEVTNIAAGAKKKAKAKRASNFVLDRG
ncbi:MAG: diguanylate cyclase [Candidatus Omnitrophica bacterium]|nr:diguanylate cyclase [Candidatus Omnitrophota bacterium]